MTSRDDIGSKLASLSRRRLLRDGTLSAAAIGLLAGAPTLVIPRRSEAASEQDVRILGSALSAEHEAVAAYGVAARSGLLSGPVLDLAVQFRGQHEEHVDLLASTVRKLGGEPAEPRDSYSFPVEELKNRDDVLSFAAELEKGAVSAYLGAVPILGNGELAKAAASILGDEAMHWAVLRYVLGENPVPHAFVS